MMVDMLSLGNLMPKMVPLVEYIAKNLVLREAKVLMEKITMSTEV